MSIKHLDVVIIGAGIAGISAASHLKKNNPNKNYIILERRADLGGTWDLFKYPGIRSDSSMTNYGFGFRLWNEPKILSDGASIQNYLRETAVEYGIDHNIHYCIKVISASWSSQKKYWEIDGLNEKNGNVVKYTANFLIGCTGYYDYDKPYSPVFEGENDFAGTIIHPQHWPEKLETSGKRVVVIGSGATAMTLVPSLADKCKHVTLLQRSPTYVASLPAEDSISKKLELFLPQSLTYRLARIRNLYFENITYFGARKNPQITRHLLLSRVRHQLGGTVDMKHFTPNYAPWDQRVCAVPNGDLFKSLRNGSASIETDKIKCFMKTGILLESGKYLDADIIVTATGLSLKVFGGVKIIVDGKEVSFNKRMMYKGVMLEGVPNCIYTFGYTNFSWTLKADFAGKYLSRLIRYMDKNEYLTVVANDNQNNIADTPMYDNMTSGYFKRGENIIPRQGKTYPWHTVQDIAHDSIVLRYAPIEDGVIAFDKKLSKKKYSLLRKLPRSIRFAIASLS